MAEGCHQQDQSESPQRPYPNPSGHGGPLGTLQTATEEPRQYHQGNEKLRDASIKRINEGVGDVPIDDKLVQDVDAAEDQGREKSQGDPHSLYYYHLPWRIYSVASGWRDRIQQVWGSWGLTRQTNGEETAIIRFKLKERGQKVKYDVVIVGAGSTGCALAARLSEEPKRSVLLLEAGPDYPEFEHLPDDLKYGHTQAASAVDAPHNWSFVGTATPEQTKPMLVPRGKALGGSSAINGLLFIRGVPEDYDSWASWGNNEWAYEKVLPYFRKMERDLDIQDDFHGSDGPIPLRRPKRETWLPFQKAFYRACLDAGFPENPDFNHPDSTGVSPRVENQLDGIRMSMALTYIDPIRPRINLTVRPNVLAARILFDGARATGVEVESGGERFTVEGEEIVLSAGAVASPQILMLSGVGPADHLRSLGIPVAHDLPGVGQNMREHPLVWVVYRVKEGVPMDPHASRNQVCLRYTATGSGARNDMMISPASFYSAVALGGDAFKADGVALGPILEQPISTGELKLTSTDPHVQPLMDYRFLTDPWDRQRLREGVRLCVQLFEHQAFSDIIADRADPTDQDMASDEALDAWMLRNVSCCHHISRTCKMGPSSDPKAVVDQYCRVHGVERLRVVDASVMPDIIRANTNATAVLIGERAADFIKEQI